MFNGKIHYKWPFSIAILNNQRVPPFCSGIFRPRVTKNHRIPQASLPRKASSRRTAVDLFQKVRSPQLGSRCPWLRKLVGGRFFVYIAGMYWNICFTYCKKEESKLFMTDNILEHARTAIGILFGVENDLLKQSLRGETLNNNILLAMPKFPNQRFRFFAVGIVKNVHGLGPESRL